MESAIVTITGIGQSQSVEAEAGASLGEVLRANGIDVDALQVKVNGAAADLNAGVSNGDQVVATPRDTKLG